MVYNLTSDQKQLLRDLVKHKKEKVLDDNFLVIESPDPEKFGAFVCRIQLNNGEEFRFNNIRSYALQPSEGWST